MKYLISLFVSLCLFSVAIVESPEPNSPALKLGIVPIAQSKIGLQPVSH